jgi:hypothetical protein
MKTRTFEATVMNGQIKLPEGVQLCDQTKVLVVVPSREEHSDFIIAIAEDCLPVIRGMNGVITSRMVKEIETQA